MKFHMKKSVIAICSINISLSSCPRACDVKAVKVGEKVTIKRSFKKAKLDSKYEENTGVVTSINGSMVNVSTTTKTMKRHVNQVKHYVRSMEPDPRLESTILEEKFETPQVSQEVSPFNS